MFYNIRAILMYLIDDACMYKWLFGCLKDQQCASYDLNSKKVHLCISVHKNQCATPCFKLKKMHILCGFMFFIVDHK